MLKTIVFFKMWNSNLITIKMLDKSIMKQNLQNTWPVLVQDPVIINMEKLLARAKVGQR